MWTRFLDNLSTCRLEHSEPGLGPCHLLYCRGPFTGPFPAAALAPCSFSLAQGQTLPSTATRLHQSSAWPVPGSEGPAPHLSDLIPIPLLSSLPLGGSCPLTPQGLACGPLQNLTPFTRGLCCCCCCPIQNCKSLPEFPLLPLLALLFPVVFVTIKYTVHFTNLFCLFPLQSFTDRFPSVLFPLSWNHVGHLSLPNECF